MPSAIRTRPAPPVLLLLAAAILATVVAAGACAGERVTSPSGLTYIDEVKGTGAEARPGLTAVVNYTGWLYRNGKRGRKFDSSYDRGEPFAFPIGAGKVIKGWDEGIVGMRVGGKRTLIIPPNLAYGATGAGNGAIPPYATLMFEIELVDLR